MARILVVDDNRFIRSLLSHILREDGHEAFEAEDGHEALLAVKRDHPSIIITDFYMPVMDGEALVRKLKNDPTTRSIPIIGLAGTSDSEARLIRAGVNFYLPKPLREQDLLLTLQNALRLNQEFM
jgi:CheY-like chemotaxis protein